MLKVHGKRIKFIYIGQEIREKDYKINCLWLIIAKILRKILIVKSNLLNYIVKNVFYAMEQDTKP
jgi:hypothetical protein